MGNSPAKVQQETWRDMGRGRMGASRLVCSRSRTRVIVGLDAMQTQEGEDGRWPADILGLDMLVEVRFARVPGTGGVSSSTAHFLSSSPHHDRVPSRGLTSGYLI
jgi:hypothetical protein